MRHLFTTRRLSVTFALLVAGIFGAAFGGLVLIQRTQRQSLAELLESETRERSGTMARVVELTGQSLRDFTFDYSQWDEMVTFVGAPTKSWADINLDPALKNFNLAAVWVLETPDKVIYATRGASNATVPVLPLSEDDWRRISAEGRGQCCFVARGGEVMEICVSPIQPSADSARTTRARGWLVAARLWDEALLKLIADVVQGEAAVEPITRPLPAPQANHISIHHPLPGLDGKPAANLRVTLSSHELEIVSRDQRRVLFLFAGTFLLTAAAAVYFVFRWIVRPLRVVGRSLQTRDTRPIESLLRRQDEIGGVALAVKTSFEQHATLEEMVEGRIRLGRELHDGLIQTVYAAGMSLAGVRTALRNNPVEAERMLDEIRAELNTSIRDLREFIQGLEPEPPAQRTFREAVQSIMALMQGVRRVACTVRVDDTVASQLDARQRLSLLQMTREAISNSVRHGQAKQLLIRLERTSDGIVLEITDDGVGLASAPADDGGRGLANFAARARELGGDLQVAAMPDGGVRVQLMIPRLKAGRD